MRQYKRKQTTQNNARCPKRFQNQDPQNVQTYKYGVRWDKGI